MTIIEIPEHFEYAAFYTDEAVEHGITVAIIIEEWRKVVECQQIPNIEYFQKKFPFFSLREIVSAVSYIQDLSEKGGE